MKTKMKIKNRKIILLIIGSIFVLIIIILNIFSTEFVENVDNIEIKTIEPAEETSEEINYETNIFLYFPDKYSGVMSKEKKTIDVRKLIDNPYIYIMELLIRGPEDDSLNNSIPKDTKVNSIILNKGTLIIDLSKEFLNNDGTDSIYSIVNTMSEFNEVNNIKFLIDGKVIDGLKNEFVKK